jgi:hypothetical protein
VVHALERGNDHPGLFMIRSNGQSAASDLEETRIPVGRSVLDRATSAAETPLRRYCAGCSRETEHGAWGAARRAGIPTIRWPGTETASGTTICLDCGQLRALASQPSPPGWSSWPRKAAKRQGGATLVELQGE